MTKRTLYKTPEGILLFIGILMTLLLVGVIGYYLIKDPLMSKTLSLVFVAHTFGGRAAGIGLCIMDSLNGFITIFYNFYLEVLIVFLTYALFVLSINNYVKLRSVRFFALRLGRKARKYKDRIENYGWIGLFFFVMAPLPATGPVIGSIIGYLLKFSLWRNFSATFIGTLVAIVVWFICFDFLEQHLHIIRYIFAGIVAIVVFSYLLTLKDWFKNSE